MHRKLPALAIMAFAIALPAQAVAARYGERTLRVGKSGADVRVLQRHLDRAGHETVADGRFGPATARSVRAFERAEERRPNAVVTRYEQRLLSRHSRAGTGGSAVDAPHETPGEKAVLDGNGLAVAPASAPQAVKDLIAAGNRIARKPYKYGGGHARWRDSGYDCSGSISYVLHAAGLLRRAMPSGGFMRWGRRGRGDWITVRANPGHAYLIVAGLRFDTSARKATGTRWSDELRSARSFAGRHPAGF